MGGNFEQVGQYLMQNGKMPTNVQQYQGQVNQVQNMINDNKQ
jgi:DNA-binding FrmR family transcriptional regulator